MFWQIHVLLNHQQQNIKNLFLSGLRAASIASFPGLPIAVGGNPENFLVLYFEFSI